MVTLFTLGFDRTNSILRSEPAAVGITVNFSNILETLGPATDVPLNRAVNRFRCAGEVQQRRGNHNWTAGFEIARRQWNGSEFSGHRGILYFRNDFGNDGITNLRLGLASRFAGSVGTTVRGFRGWNLGFHAGDTWRVRPDLTLSYGLRYEPFPGITEVNRIVEIPFDCDCNNVGPRFGLAWRRSWGTLRAAYGTHFGEILMPTLQQLRFNPPGSIKVEIQKPNIVDPFGSLPPEQLAPGARSIFTVLEPNLAVPYDHHWTLSYEHEFPAQWRMTLGYIGTRTHKLLSSWYTNRALPAPRPEDTLTQNINDRRPDPNYFDYRRILNVGRGFYDAARITLVTPGWRGLAADVSYWFSKSIDHGTNFTNLGMGDDARIGQAQSELFMREDMKGLSSFDQPHAFLARITFLIPRFSRATWAAPFRSWTLSSVVLAKKGTPFTVISGSDGPGFGNVEGSPSDRPHIIDPSVLGRTIGHPDTAPLRMPRSAFQFMQPGELRGNIGTNTFRRGPIRNWNAAVARTWTVHAEQTLTFQAEAVNLTNRPQFAEPGRELASPNFGQITNTLNEGRAFLFSARFRW